MPKKMIPEFTYVSPVEGRAVVRFPSLAFGSSTPIEYIGAKRVFDKTGRGKLVWDVGAVIAISRTEFIQFRKSYKRHLKDGDLIERTEAEFKEYLSRRAEENFPVQEESAQSESDVKLSRSPSKAKGAKKS